MGKGEFPTTLMVIVVFTVLIGISLYIVFSTRSSLLLSNECWDNVIGGLLPFDGRERKPPQLILDGECVEKIGFTSSKSACISFCTDYDDDKERDDCIIKCEAIKEEARTFIVAVPKSRGFISKTLGFVKTRKFDSFLGGKLWVFVLFCEVQDIDSAISECEKKGNKWVCAIPGKTDEEKEAYKNTYTLVVEKSEEGKTCTIRAA